MSERFGLLSDCTTVQNEDGGIFSKLFIRATLAESDKKREF